MSAFDAAVAAYRACLAAEGATVDPLRAETHVEAWKDWSTAGTLAEAEAWFEAQRAANPMRVVDIPLREVAGWHVDPATGNVRHDRGAFFVVHGVRVSNTAGREVGVGGWDQPMMTQIGFDGGVLGLLRQRRGGVPMYLVEAKAEPGNYQRVQISPTLQATFANLERAHRGRRPHFADWFVGTDRAGGQTLWRAWLSEDGGRLHRKRNLGVLVEAPAGAEIVAPPCFRWMSLWQLKALLDRNAIVNPHIRGILAGL